MQEPTSKAQLLERIRAGRAALHESFVSFADDRLGDPGVAGHWSVKDILAHVVWWEQQTLAKLGGAKTAHDQLGGEDKEAQIDRVNDSVYQEHRDRPAAEVKATYGASGLKLSETLNSLGEDVVLSNLEFIAENTYRHYPEHAAQIQAWQAGKQVG
jgi:hypothetical protein